MQCVGMTIRNCACVTSSEQVTVGTWLLIRGGRMIAYSSTAHAGYLFYAFLGGPVALKRLRSMCWLTAS